MTTLTLVRHGQASFGAANYDQLSPKGIQQSQVLRDYWQRIGSHASAVVYSGSLSRQRDTARLALPETSLTQNPAFNEYDFEGIQKHLFPLIAREHPELVPDPVLLLKDKKLFQAFFEKSIEYWLSGRGAETGQIESWTAFSSRVRQGLQQLAQDHRDQHSIVFTSGGVIAVALQQALKLSDEHVFELNWRIFNASVHVFRWGRKGLSLQSFNNVAHLELAQDPTLITFR